MEKIKNLMFDLGGVIMNIKRQNAVDALKKLGMTDVDTMLGDYEQKGPFLELENGSMNLAEFHSVIRRYLPVDVSDEEFDAAFELFLTGIPTERLHALERLHKDYNIYLLSNTNPIMWNGRIMEEFRKEGQDINYYFDNTVASFEAKAYKPDAKIFRIAEKRFNITPEETIFFDDSKANCAAAEALGFHAVHVRPSTEFYDYLPQSE